jgi:hypothetical protein
VSQSYISFSDEDAVFLKHVQDKWHRWDAETAGSVKRARGDEKFSLTADEAARLWQIEHTLARNSDDGRFATVLFHHLHHAVHTNCPVCGWPGREECYTEC